MRPDRPGFSAILLATNDAGRVLLTLQTDGPFAGAWLLPGGRAEEGESLEDAVQREVREETGAEVRDLKRIARYEVRGTGDLRFHLHVQMFHGAITGALRAEEGSEVGWIDPVALDPHPVLARQLADGGVRPAPHAELEAALRDAGISMRALGLEGEDRAWYAESTALLEEAYLNAPDPVGQSGMSGDLARWERGRRPIANGIHRDGTFLDVGCANGLLMESLVRWVAEQGHRIEPYGLDLSERIAALARGRLPQWADRVFVGNALGWRPPFRFDFVRTELEYVPRYRVPELVAHVLEKVVARGGRLIVCGYGSARFPAPRAERVGDTLRELGYRVAGEAEAADTNGAVFVRVAWVDAV